jgi:hypothetical protein
MHRSYRVMKSSLVTTSEVGVGGGDILRLALSRTTLAQEGAMQASWGLAGREGTCCRPPSSQDLPSTPREGEAVRRGEGLSV